jgi:hypothetical protein
MILKKIHYCWLSDDPLPALVKQCIDSWHKYLPEYEFILWDRRRFDIDSVAWVKQAYESRKFAFAADYIRLYAIYTEGGIYLDSDVEVLKSFDDLLDQGSFIGFETGGDLEPAVFGARSNCNWVAECLKYYQERHFVRSDGTLDMTPLPIILEHCLRETGLMLDQTSISNPVCGADVTFYPAEFFSPKNVYSKVVDSTNHTYTVHHFDGQWVEQTPLHRFKRMIHSALHFSIGPMNHRRIVKVFRRVRK